MEFNSGFKGLTMNVLKFHEKTNVTIRGAHFIKRFSLTKSRV